MEITASGRCSTSQPTQPLMKLFLCAPSLCSSEFGTHVTAHSAKPPMTWECLIFPGTYDVEKKHYTPDSGAPQCTWEKFSLLSLVSSQQVARSSVVDVIPAAKLLQLHRFQQEKKLPLTGLLNQIFNAFRAAGFPYWAEDQFVAAEPYIWFLNVVSAWDTAPAIWDFAAGPFESTAPAARRRLQRERRCAASLRRQSSARTKNHRVGQGGAVPSGIHGPLFRTNSPQSRHRSSWCRFMPPALPCGPMSERLCTYTVPRRRLFFSLPQATKTCDLPSSTGPVILRCALCCILQRCSNPRVVDPWSPRGVM